MFDIGVSAAAILAHIYFWKRLVRDTALPPVARRGVTLVLGLLLAVVLAAVNLSESVNVDYAGWFAWPGYGWLGVTFYLFMALLVTEPVRLVLLRWRNRDWDPDTAMSRRTSAARATAIVAVVAAVGISGYGVSSVLRPPNVTELSVGLDGLATEFDGFRIALVADIHVGAMSGRAHTERIVSVINQTDPDIVAIAGDLVEDGTVQDLGPAIAPLVNLHAREGTFFVTGNHEYFTPEVESWRREIQRLGIHELRNERIEIRRGNGFLDLAGVNDIAGSDYSDQPDYTRALEGRDRSRPIILLAHQPAMVTDAAEYSVDLQLSGHTHGGQMWPFHYLIPLGQPALDGLTTVGGTQLVTTRGAGFWGPPLRVGAPADITLLTLHPTDPRSGT